MTKRSRLIWYKVIILLIVIVILIMPTSSGTMPEIDMRVLVTAFGIDSLGDDLKVSAQIVIPSSAGTESNKQEVVSADGTSLAVAINNLSARIGRKLDLGTCTVFVMGDEICKKGVTELIEHLAAGDVVSPGASLIATNKMTAEQLLIGLNLLSQSVGAEIQTFVQYVDQGAHVATLSIKDFLSRTATVSNGAFMPVIEINEAGSSQGGSQGSSQGGSGSQGGGKERGEQSVGAQTQGGSAAGELKSKEVSTLKNFNKVKLFKDGKEVKVLSKDDSEGLAWLDRKAIKGVLETDEFEIDGKIQKFTGQLKYKRSTRKVTIKNGKPMITVKLTAYVNLGDNQVIKSDESNPKKLKASHNLIKKEFENKIEKVISNSVIASKREGTDFFMLEDDFFRVKNKEYKKYKKEHPDEFLKDVLVDYDIHVNLN